MFVCMYKYIQVYIEIPKCVALQCSDITKTVSAPLENISYLCMYVCIVMWHPRIWGSVTQCRLLFIRFTSFESMLANCRLLTTDCLTAACFGNTIRTHAVSFADLPCQS